MDLNLWASVASFLQFIMEEKIPNKTCLNHTYEFWNGLLQTKPWALRMVDSMGKIPSGIMEGNLANFGNMDECLDVNVDEHFGTFIGRYCLLKFPFPILFNGVAADISHQWGICIPSSCTAGDLQNFLSNTLPLEIEIEELRCQTREGRPYETQELVTIAILSFLTLLAIISTIYDYVKSSDDRNRYLLSFSLKTNVRNLLDTTSHRSLRSVHGVRVGATMVVIMAHVYWMQASSFSSINISRISDWLSDWGHVWLVSRALMVDVFFVFGGLLVSYTFMKEQSKGKSFNLAIHFIHRYLRLTPAMAVTLLFNATLFRRIGSGPMWKIESQEVEEECQNNWWIYMLYINNWYRIRKCMVHTWYIAIDAQLYFLSPVLLIPLGRWPRFGIGLTFAALIAAFFTSFGISYANKEHVEAYRHHNSQVEAEMHSTYHRTTPWLIGFIMGYFLQKYEKSLTQRQEGRRIRKVTRHKIPMSVLITVIVLVIFVSPLLGIHPFTQADYQYNALISATYLATSHVLIACSIAVAVVACGSGYGGIFHMLFSWKLFVPLSRLTYSIYMIHMTLLASHIFSVRTPGYVSDYDMIMTTVSVAFLSVILSPILYLLVEKPAATLERMLLHGADQQTPALPTSQPRDGGHTNFARDMPKINARKCM